jgi:uncharacterized protein (UPF0276 family)
LRLADIPHLGSGLALRPQTKVEMFAAAAKVDFVEIPSDRYAFAPHLWGDLERARERFRHLVPHGIDLSIGSAVPPDRAYLRAIKRLADFVHAPYYSEHLSVTRTPGVRVGSLAPLWLTEETLASTVARVRQVQEFLERPLVLETITTVVEIPHAGMPAPEFFARLVAQSDCGILLDLANIHINATNHKFDADAFVDAMPLSAVIQVHLAGGMFVNGTLVDGHCRPVPEDVWTLFERVTRKANVRGVLIEHDTDFPPFAELLAQVERARSLLP